MYLKKNVSKKEFEIHNIVQKIKTINVPKIFNYNEQTKELEMEKIPEMCISDMYGSESSSVPEYLFDEIRRIIITLKDNNIAYPDITGYNFIEYKDKVYIIDFGDAEIIKNKVPDFVNEFINGLNSWNPEFE